jgi:tetratricopeptide (TPR) repeat protein
MNEHDLQRWTRDVAEDPGAPSFIRLARAYRAQGRRDAARAVVLRGLERNPEHLDAHCLLALIHVEEGDPEQARDEWEVVLRLDPGNFAASRGLGFLALERGDLVEARRHLQAAAAARPHDPAVAEAGKLVDRRLDAPPAPPPATGASARVEDGSGTRQASTPGERDPAAVFAPLLAEPPFRGALLLDAQGLVLAGNLSNGGGEAGTGGDRGEVLGAVMNAVVDEARRTAELVRIGAWQGLLIDCEGATLHVAVLPGDAVLVLAARPRTPAGWMVRTASRARAMARHFLEVPT